MTREEEQARILKNLIMSDDYISQEDLKKVVKAMDKPEVEKRPEIQYKGVETR